MLQKNALVTRKTYYSGRSFPQNQCIKRKIVNISNFFKKSVFLCLMIHSQRLLRYAISRKEEAASSNLWLSTNCRNKSLRLYLTILSHCYVNMLQGSDRQNNTIVKFIGLAIDIIQV